jgi:hypothetical protein
MVSPFNQPLENALVLMKSISKYQLRIWKKSYANDSVEVIVNAIVFKSINSVWYAIMPYLIVMLILTLTH